MELTVQQYLDAVQNQDYDHQEWHVSPEHLAEKGLPTYTHELYDRLRKDLGDNRLAQLQLTVDYPDRPATFTLETGIINLPLRYATKIGQFFQSEDETVPVRLYLIVESEDINVTGLRIDEMTTTDDYLKQFTETNADINDAIFEKNDFLQLEAQKPHEEPVPEAVAKKAPAKQTTTRKTTAKKKTTTTRKKATTTRKRTTTRKTAAAKKPAAKKTTTRRKTTTKKTTK
ncbi:hypothetical protein IV38_GL001817 [Lactobacillus selangorensis]|uniref:Uncharacterized protein n=1 Tax=Lactobacillus selangorensis TaxID=81857 RepID=A0A0R2FPT4_9LACO|nr:hypothetical protein [Lactobacillus selangorensis]KRN27976.1 hypothetical protein IV38_GL001817 [Lactobacillus selangorensis]KRN30553.1 hypothetical protein IV40_GL001738 [Lactobacillus selangorensis]